MLLRRMRQKRSRSLCSDQSGTSSMRRTIAVAVLAVLVTACAHRPAQVTPPVSRAHVDTTPLSVVHDTVWRTDTLIVRDTVRLTTESHRAPANATLPRSGGVVDHLPTDAQKPEPKVGTYDEGGVACPDTGRGKSLGKGAKKTSRVDPILNRRKNRVDEPSEAYIEATPAAILENEPSARLPKYRAEWSNAQVEWV